MTEKEFRDKWMKDIQSEEDGGYNVNDLEPLFIAIMDDAADDGQKCIALGLIAYAATYVLNKEHKNGGMSGFQAGAVFWEFAKPWLGIKDHAAILQYEEMLYPQNFYKFGSIDEDTWKWLQAEAKEKLNDNELPEPTVLHLESIVNGQVPFGMKVL